MSLGPLPPLHVPPHPIPGFLPPSHAAPDIVSHMGDFPITESSKLTQALVGATFVQPACVDYQGRKSLMFVFAVSHTISTRWSLDSDTLLLCKRIGPCSQN
jgi:hypothetical protein